MGSAIHKNSLAADLELVLEHAHEVWDELRNSNIFITGGTGLYGSWLLESLLWANARMNLKIKMVVLTRNPHAFIKRSPHLVDEAAVQLLCGDVKDFQFPSQSFTHVIHAATEASAKLTQENPQLMYDTIVQGMERVLQFAQQCRAGKLLFTSSGAVYGKQPVHIDKISEDYFEQHVQEDHKAAYGLGKIVAEKMCMQAARHDFAVKIMRGFACVGPYLPLDIHFAIGNFILNGLRGEDIHIKGDGTPYRSYIYMADLIIWLLQILVRGESCQAYNVGSEHEISVYDLAQTVARHFVPTPKIVVAQKSVLGRLPERYVPSTKKARERLGLHQTFSLNDAIIKTRNWYLFKGGFL